MNITIKLTEEQIEMMKPLFDEVTRAYNDPDRLPVSIMGQPLHPTCVTFVVLDHETSLRVALATGTQPERISGILDQRKKVIERRATHPTSTTSRPT